MPKKDTKNKFIYIWKLEATTSNLFFASNIQIIKALVGESL
jgi:hypothetical protein